jgi:hypothetical protein
MALDSAPTCVPLATVNDSGDRHDHPDHRLNASGDPRHGRRTRQKLPDEARRATYQVHAQGRYPSAHRVAPLLSQPDSLRGGVAMVAWQEALRELGWLGGTGSTAPSV